MRNTRNLLIAMVLTAAVAVGAGTLAPDLASRVAYAVQSAKADTAAQRLQSTDSLSTAFQNVAETIKPSVVSIRSVKRVQAMSGMRNTPSPFENSPFRDRFGDDFFERFFQPRERGQGYVQRGLGSGVIVSEDGYVLTNNHVVADADEVTVQLSDNRTFTGEVVGTDPKTDLAVLKIDASGLHPAMLGDSEDLRIGEWVVAAGNPFGLASTITSGIVSAKGRANVGIADYEDFIQTDAAINPGNSGGPLVNLRGEVVGVNTAIFTRSGGYMGIGFAIPVNMAKSIMHSLIDEGRVVRGYLGVMIQNLDEGLASSFGYDSTDGVVVGDVAPNSPASKAGLESGDIITSYDGKPVKNVDKLRARVADTKPGTRVDVEVFREGKHKELEIRIGELEAQQLASATASPAEDLGMTLHTVSPELAQRMGLEDDVSGVVVTNVEPLGPADRAGIQNNDVIVSVQGKNVTDLSDFRSELGKHDLKNGVRLGVRTGGMRRFVFLKTD